MFSHLVAGFFRDMFAMLVVSISSTNFFSFGLAFLFIFPIHFGDVDLETLFTENSPAFGLGFCVILGPTSCDREFRTLFFESNAFAMFVFLPTFRTKDCKTLFVKRPIRFGHIQGLFCIFALEVWRRVAIRAWFALR